MSDLNDLFKALATAKATDPKHKQAKKIEEEVKQVVKSDLSDLFAQLATLQEKVEILPEETEGKAEAQQMIAEVMPEPVREEVSPLTPDVERYLTNKTGSVFKQPEENVTEKNIEDVKKKIKYLEQWVGKIAVAGPGSGEVNLRYLDDVDRLSIADRLNLQYNDTSKKFEFTRPIVSVYPVIKTANAVLIDTPTPTIITDMTLTPPAGTYLVNFNSQFTVDSTSSQTLQAKADLIILYDELIALTATGSETDRGANPLTYGSETLGPGVYIQTGATNVTGTLTLDAGDDPNALFVFRTAGAFTTGVGAEVVLAGGATSSNVFFVSQGAASTAADAIFRGTILANQAAVSTGAGTTLEGRMLAINGAVSLGAASILTAPTGTINSSLTLGTVLAIFNMFAGTGSISSTGASEVQLSVGTNAGTITGFDTATVGGSLIPGGSSSLAIFRCAVFVDNVIIPDSLRSDTRPIAAETFEFPFILQTIATLDGTQTIDVRARSLLGIQTVGPRMSLILTLVQV